jgi:hypothetical protein
MRLSEKQVSHAVNKVMGEMFYLSPDLDALGRQQLDGPAPQKGIVLHLGWSDEHLLQLIFEWNLLKLMTANLTALPPDELPRDWIQQTACEASAVVRGQCLTLYNVDDQETIRHNYPEPAEANLDITGARWHFNFRAESCRLNVSLIEEALL